VFKLYSASNLQDAWLVHNLLAQNGIESRVLNENLQGGLGELPFTQVYPEVWLVHKADQLKARELITEFEHPSADSRKIKCPSCAEENPGNFEVCWSCGHEMRLN